MDVAPIVDTVSVNGKTLTIEFDQNLDSAHLPPANCEELEEVIENFDCDDVPDLAWFTITGTTAVIDSVTVAGRAVTLILSKRVAKGESISVSYQPQSLQSGRWNLRDTSTPGNQAESFGPESADNETPAAALNAAFDRTNADLITVSFDADLKASPVNTASLSVTVDGVAAVVSGATIAGATLSVALEQPVAECATISLKYTPGTSPLQDTDGHNIEAFAFDIDNFIDADWSLKCVRFDSGGILLTFADGEVPNRAGFEWSLSVDGEARDVDETATGDVVQLQPTTSVCKGDVVTAQYASTTETDNLSLQRTIETAAPCAVSAAANAAVLSVAFDQELADILPSVSDFAISGGASITEVGGINGSVLSLQLASPGLSPGQEAVLGYQGTSLRRTALTVGPFSLLVVDETPPPELVSASADIDTLTLTFDQALLDIAVPPSRFTLSGQGIDQQVTAVSIDGESASLSLSAALSDDPESFEVAYDAGSAGGLAGLTGARVGDSTFQVQNVTAPPVLVSASGDGLTVELEFDRELLDVAVPASRFTLSGEGVDQQVAAVSIDGDSALLTLSAPLGDEPESFEVEYDAGSADGLAGLDGARVSDAVFVAANQTAIPALVSASADVDTVTLEFDQQLLDVEVPTSWFTVSGEGVDLQVTAVSIDGYSAQLTLSAALSDEPANFAVEYDAGDSGGLAGLTGARVQDSIFQVENVTSPPELVTARGDGLYMVLEFTQELLDVAVPASRFTLSGEEVDQQVESVSMTGLRCRSNCQRRWVMNPRALIWITMPALRVDWPGWMGRG